jgi:hypothetical protein
MTAPRLLLIAALAFTGISRGHAENLPADHPSSAAVKEYLKAVVKEDWKTAADMLLPKSLDRLKQSTVNAIKNARTMSEEAAMLGMFGVKDIRDLEKMSSQETYVLDRKAVHERNRIKPDDLKRKQETLNINILGLVPEDSGKIVHAVVRTKQETTEMMIEELLIISVVRDQQDSKKWYVVPDMQVPLTTPLKAAEGAAAEPKKDEKK